MTAVEDSNRCVDLLHYDAKGSSVGDPLDDAALLGQGLERDQQENGAREHLKLGPARGDTRTEQALG